MERSLGPQIFPRRGCFQVISEPPAELTDRRALCSQRFQLCPGRWTSQQGCGSLCPGLGSLGGGTWALRNCQADCARAWGHCGPPLQVGGLGESHSVRSNSLQSHGLHSPWNSPGQNTGVGSHSLLQDPCGLCFDWTCMLESHPFHMCSGKLPSRCDMDTCGVIRLPCEGWKFPVEFTEGFLSWMEETSKSQAPMDL